MPPVRPCPSRWPTDPLIPSRQHWIFDWMIIGLFKEVVSSTEVIQSDLEVTVLLWKQVLKVTGDSKDPHTRPCARHVTKWPKPLSFFHQLSREMLLDARKVLREWCCRLRPKCLCWNTCFAFEVNTQKSNRSLRQHFPNLTNHIATQYGGWLTGLGKLHQLLTRRDPAGRESYQGTKNWTSLIL
jgi:hypothetical protein